MDAAAEFGTVDVLVNNAGITVGPGSTMSGPFGQMTAEQKTAASSAFGLGRIGEPTDTAGVVAFPGLRGRRVRPPATSSTTPAASAGPSGSIARNQEPPEDRLQGGRGGRGGRGWLVDELVHHRKKVTLEP